MKKLWGILKPVCKKEPLENMRGKTLCVDLSTWICQAEETMFLKTAVAKPYLRNTIFRVLCLKRLGTQLIFVTEGTPPQLKYDVVLERARARKEAEENGGLKFSKGRGRGRGTRRAGNDAGKRDKATESASSKPKKVGRSLFQRKINEVNMNLCNGQCKIQTDRSPGLKVQSSIYTTTNKRLNDFENRTNNTCSIMNCSCIHTNTNMISISDIFPASSLPAH